MNFDKEVTNCNRIGNFAKILEALELIHELLGIKGKPDTAMCIRYEAAYQIAKEALFSTHKREHEETSEDSSVVGNVAKMREALLKASVVLKDAPHYLLTDEYVNECLALIYSALSEPPRNCDSHLAKNLIGAVTLYCSKNPGLPPMVEWNAIQYLEFCKWLFAEVKED